MLAREITFEDFNGQMRTETHYFHLSQAEIVKWLTTQGDYTLDKVLQRLSEERNGKEIMRMFDELIYLSYGKKSLDGRRLDKSKEAKDDFFQTEAYSALFMELVTDAKKAAEFVNGIIPKNLASEVDRLMKDHPEAISS